MSLAEAINSVLRVRGLTRKELLDRLPQGSSPWAVYRILAGKSMDPRLSTVITICQALDVSPTELMQLAGSFPFHARGTGTAEVRLRQAFREVQGLQPETKELAIQEIEGLLDILKKWKSTADERQQHPRDDALVAPDKNR